MYKVTVSGLKGIKATIIADSVDTKLSRITTFELEYPRFIHSELMTHRLFSRNAASSRAIPIAKMMEMVATCPASPVYWGADQAGMQAGQEVDEVDAEYVWMNAAERAVESAKELQAAGLHKQIVNRVLEPFQMMKTIVTATEFDNWFWLRNHPDAQPEIHELASIMLEAYQKSSARLLKPGEWHVPYVDTGEEGYCVYNLDGTTVPLTEEEALKVSASCCAQVSYRVLDDSLEKALMVYDKLVGSVPCHCYDDKTEVLTEKGFIPFKELTTAHKVLNVDEKTLKHSGFVHPAEVQHGAYTGEMFVVDNGKVSMAITAGHKVIGQTVSTCKDRYGEFAPDVFTANTKASNKSNKGYRIEQETRVPVVLNTEDMVVLPLGKLIGMYLGDGFRVDNTIAFHLKKERKIEYLTDTLECLGFTYSTNLSKDGTTYIRVYKNDMVTSILNTCKSGSKDKEIGVWDTSLYPGIFDGLKNSDGSVQRNTWSYSTASETLKNDFLSFGPLAGVNVKENSPKKGVFSLMVQTRLVQRLNDTRAKNSKVHVINVSDEPVHCCTVPGGALVVRRNGHILISGNSSPFEHQATPMPPNKIHPLACTSGKGVTAMDNRMNFWSGNFKGWVQHRQLIDNNTCWDYNP